MNTTDPASQREHDLALLAAGYDTGWWDEHGRPAPWPEDFWLPDGTIHPDWQPTGNNPRQDTEPAKPSENYNF
ncbi:hypothetical protein [Arthrobacter sp. A2-55]|uniref:hypothetical protein n=1 Tax=Arthrobacter sp. A2-55 TaxID=2897337 RepID=UPI0021CDBE11|nr:hypothetical protein [Arthrobacter sp. A2-55]MCU6479521.1 hypothetical protein [Arthrobacter sp. A2-55]